MFKRLRKDSRGNVMLIAGMSLPVVFGAAGLAIDTVQWTLAKRQLQRAADSAAIAGAYALSQGRNASDAATNDLGKSTDIAFTSVIASAPTSGGYVGNPDAVQVTLQSPQTGSFSQIFLAQQPTITATATAAKITNGSYCVTALVSNTSTGIMLQGSSTVNLGCGMATNSISSSGAIIGSGSSTITASPLTAVGYIAPSNNFGTGTVLNSYSAPQQDPFASLPNPVVPNGCNSRFSDSPGSVTNISNLSGVRCFSDFNVKGTVTLDPGVYIINGGDLNLGSQANMSGSGVTFILTSSTAASNPGGIANVSINGSATINISAPTTGTYAGVLIYQDRRAVLGGTNSINGNAYSSFQGAFYFPSQLLQFNGDAGMDTRCVQIAAYQVTFLGNSSISNVCPAGLGSFQGTVVRLVE